MSFSHIRPTKDYTAGELAERLAARADDIARTLLPNGKQEAGEWCAGSVGGEKGKSLKVHLSGPKAGVWADFAGNDKGDLLDLICAVKGVKLIEAMRFARELLGLPVPEHERRSYQSPKGDPASFKGRPKDPHRRKIWEYLTGVRKIAPKVLISYGVGMVKGWATFPYRDRVSGKLVQMKHIQWNQGKKNMRTEAGCAPALFGWQAISSTARSLLITEGEIDALSWATYGIPAVSVPFGAGIGHKNDWIDYEWEALQQFDQIYLCYDPDKPGQAAEREVAHRIGLHRARIIRLPKPHKDPNDCLVAGVTKLRMLEAIEKAIYIEPEFWREPKSYYDEICEYLWPTDEDRKEHFESRICGKNLIFRPAEVTLWTGSTSHGKSTVLTQIMLESVAAGYRWAVASPEMRGPRLLGKAVRQWTAGGNYTPGDVKDFLDAVTGKLWLVDVYGNIPQKTLFEAFLYGRQRFGIQHFIIDSLMKVDIAVDDYEGQRQFFNKLVEFAQVHRVHIHVVAHPRKPGTGGDSAAMERTDVRGSGDIINQPDNIIVIWRHREKERKVHDGQTVQADSPDALLIVEKQRETGWEGKVRLYWHPESQTFLRDHTGEPTDYRKWTFPPIEG